MGRFFSASRRMIGFVAGVGLLASLVIAAAAVSEAVGQVPTPRANTGAQGKPVPHKAKAVAKGTVATHKAKVAPQGKIRPQDKNLTSYAPPLVYGPFQLLDNYIVSTPTWVTVNFQPVGDTRLEAEVKYIAPGGSDFVTRPLLSGIPFQITDGYSSVSVHFRGNPLGSGVNGSYSP